MNIIVYCRVSSRDQVDGTSLESQQAACRQYAAHRGWNVLEVFIEEGESAKFADRTKLLELLAFCKDHTRHVEALLVWKLDRFARNIEDHYMIKATLRRMGVRIVSVTEAVDADPNGKLMEAILAGFAQFDNDIRAVRSVQGMSQRIKEGIWPWQAPLGYLPPKIGKKREPDRPDPASFDFLKKAWQLLASGAYSKAAVLRLLRSWGVHGYRGNLITPQTFDRLVRNPFYAGVVRDPWTGTEYPGRHVPMVTADEFAQVQRVIHKRNNSVPHHKNHADFPMRGLVRCPTCSRLLTGGWTQGSHARYPYYSCNHRPCPRWRKSLPASLIHAEFEELLPDLTIPSGVTLATVEALHSMASEHSHLSRIAATKRRERIDQVQIQIQETVAMRASRLLSDEEFITQRDRLRRKLVDLQAEASDRTVRPLARHEAGAFVQGLGDLFHLWKKLGVVEKHAFGELLFPMGYVYQRIRTTDRGLLFKTFEGSSDVSSHVVAPARDNPHALLHEIRKFLAIIGGVEQAAEEAA